MTQERQSHRETKKKPAMTLKEKRNTKKSKRAEHTAPAPANPG
jgi:hypothetical protein